MKYFLVEIAEGDAKIAGKGMYEYATRNEAVASFHSKMGVAMKSELYSREQLLVINSANGVEVSEVFERPYTPKQEVDDVEEEMPTPMDSDNNKK